VNAKDLQVLRENVGRQVLLHCTDGEIILAEIHSVSEEDEDLIYDVVASNRSKEPLGGKDGAAYLIPLSDVRFVELPPALECGE
jgi:hypothetical protein